MQLYKYRSFSEFFQDTFTFLKENGKHFFKHYFIINGVFLLILMGIGYVFTRFYTDMVFGGLLGGKSTTSIDSYINENFGLFIVILFVFLLLALVAGMVSYAYVPIYLKLYNSHSDKNFSTKHILDVYKSNLNKLLIFLISSILLAIPLIITFIIGALMLTITIVGILAIPLLIGAFMLFYGMTLMEYLENKRGIWESFGYSWELIKSKFWAAVGCVGLFYVISYLIRQIVTIIPYLFGMASLFTTVESGSPSNEEVGSVMTITMLFVFFISFLLSAILGTITLLNQGIIFYSLKEENENINTKRIIDQIGSGE